MTEKRNYVMKRRAEAQDATRLKIVEAAMHLHGEVGARNTTISAIAERAGVQRLTVYRHFPSEFEVFQACTSHWLGLNTPPDPATWAAIGDPMARAQAGIAAIYGYYGRTQRMLALSYRDVDTVPALQQPMAELANYVAAAAAGLAAGFKRKGKAQTMLSATLAHAVHFLTWQNLESLGLDNERKVALALAWLHGCQPNP